MDVFTEMVVPRDRVAFNVGALRALASMTDGAVHDSLVEIRTEMETWLADHRASL